MLDQRVAKLLLYSLFITLFPTQADHISHNLDRYGHEDLSRESYGTFTSPANPIQTIQRNREGPTPYPNIQFNQPRSNKTSATHRKIYLGLQHAKHYLQRNNLNLTVAQRGANLKNKALANTIKALLKWNQAFTPQAMSPHFHLKPLVQSSSNKSKFTGYYTPIISAQLTPNRHYRYPIYRSPSSWKRRLSRARINDGGLKNQGLEVAWTNDPIGLFYLQIQGSGIIQLPNGERKTLKFDGSNDKRFRSIARYMQNKGFIANNPSRTAIKQWFDRHPKQMKAILNINPRYIYFTLDDKPTITASGIPIVSGHTVAVDTRYIPFGAVILAEVPISNRLGQQIAYEWRILFPQDRGNAIRGPARMDIYTGVGESARLQANRFTGYGKAYLLLSKPMNNNPVTAGLDAPHIPSI